MLPIHLAGGDGPLEYTRETFSSLATLVWQLTDGTWGNSTSKTTSHIVTILKEEYNTETAFTVFISISGQTYKGTCQGHKKSMAESGWDRC